MRPAKAGAECRHANKNTEILSCAQNDDLWNAALRMTTLLHFTAITKILAPAAWVPDVAAALGTPLTGNPDGSTMRRTAVFAGNPDVAMAIPAVIAGNPDPVAMHGLWLGDDFDGTRGRWADADHDLRVGHADGEKESAGCGEELFLHCFRISLNCS
jgi:hypothetical protein